MVECRQTKTGKKPITFFWHLVIKILILVMFCLTIKRYWMKKSKLRIRKRKRDREREEEREFER